jgi:small-conductance mechanosensitive channel
VHLLVVTLLTLGALVWIILRARRRKSTSQSTPIDRAARLFGLLGVSALAVSAGSNLLGNVTLAELLTRATLDSGYFGLVLFAGASVVGSIIRHVLARRGQPNPNDVAGHTGPLLETLARLIQYGAAAAWVLLTLNEFRVLRPIVDWARRVLAYPFGLGAISLTLGGILLFFVSVYLAFWVARTMRSILRDDVLGRMSLPRGVANSVSTLTYYALVTIGLLFALAAAGFQVGQLAIVIGALGVGIGFGLQNVVNNFVSGLILMFERPIQPGDVVEITGTTGKVREIGMRATTLTTAEGADVVVPNGTLLSEKLVNWTLRDTSRRIDVDIGVAYDSDPRQVLELLRQVAVGTPGVAQWPAPDVVLKSFGPSSLVVGVQAWTSEFAASATIRTELAVRMQEALKAARIEIPLPQQDVHVRSLPDGVLAAPPRPAGPVPAPAD